MNAVRQIVDSSPLYDLPELYDSKMQDVAGMLHANKLIARKFMPNRLPIMLELERMFNQYKGKDPNKFYPGLASGIRRIAKQNGLNLGFIDYVIEKAQRITSNKSLLVMGPVKSNPLAMRKPVKSRGLFNPIKIDTGFLPRSAFRPQRRPRKSAGALLNKFLLPNFKLGRRR